jgi:hypothetical protein
MIAYMQARGPNCFDFSLYREANKDLQKFSDKDAWEHFVRNGQFEGRTHRHAQSCLQPCFCLPDILLQCTLPLGSAELGPLCVLRFTCGDDAVGTDNPITAEKDPSNQVIQPSVTS